MPKHDQINLSLEKTDLPGFPSTPISAQVTFEPQKLHIYVERTGTIGELVGESTDVRFEFDILIEDIVSVKQNLLPDVPDDFNYSLWNQPECPSLTVCHKDPYNVVPFFTTVFESTKSYWIKAFSKILVEECGVKVETITQPNQ